MQRLAHRFSDRITDGERDDLTSRTLPGLFAPAQGNPSSGGKEGAMITILITVVAVITVTVTITVRFKKRR